MNCTILGLLRKANVRVRKVSENEYVTTESFVIYREKILAGHMWNKFRVLMIKTTSHTEGDVL